MTTYKNHAYHLRIRNDYIGPFVLSPNANEGYLLGQFLRSNKYKAQEDPNSVTVYEIISETKTWRFELKNWRSSCIDNSLTALCSSWSGTTDSNASLSFTAYEDGDHIILTLPEFKIPFAELVN